MLVPATSRPGPPRAERSPDDRGAPVKVPESEDGLGIGSCIEGRQILDNLHRSSRCVSVWSVVHAVGRWGTITMPGAGRTEKQDLEPYC
jgi:hypothetical protein